ncbi:hypothetical protein GCM10023175_24900 [Pseudonocardia xishanensis]|uniref:Uncharacterized protein n=1 Tax=Pseudonocardia xishanensis TaxID=630995 RepID=A0ABP8RRX7_9PSEU
MRSGWPGRRRDPSPSPSDRTSGGGPPFTGTSRGVTPAPVGAPRTCGEAKWFPSVTCTRGDRMELPAVAGAGTLEPVIENGVVARRVPRVPRLRRRPEHIAHGRCHGR